MGVLAHTSCLQADLIFSDPYIKVSLVRVLGALEYNILESN